MLREVISAIIAALMAMSFMLGIRPEDTSIEAGSSAIETTVNATDTSAPEQESETISPVPETTVSEADKVPLPKYPDEAKSVPLYINGRQAPEGFAADIGGIVYAPIESFCSLLAVGNISAEAGEAYICSEGRCIPCSVSDISVKVLDVSGLLCAPVSALASASGQSVSCKKDGTVILSGAPTFPSAETVYGEEDLYWLSRIISAEARGECFEGQLAVGCVVINRTAHRSFPDTIYEVIYDDKFGVQFTPAYSGSVKNEPTASSVCAAKLCLEGFSLSDSILFFFNSSIAAGSWITANRTFTVTIGNHDFYS